MRIIIDIPEEFESDYKGDMFKDFFSRVLCDIQDGTLCGNYEKETAEMFLKAFDESVPMDKIVKQLEGCGCRDCEYVDMQGDCPECITCEIEAIYAHAIEIVKAGGKV